MRALQCMRQAHRDAGCLIHSLVLMGNHGHLVVTPRAMEDLSRFMASFCHRFAVYRNRSRNGSGKLFEERYSAKPIKSEAQAAATMAYVELNPVRACMRTHPALHPWSTCGWHTGHTATRIPRELWTPLGWYEALGRTAQHRAQVYEEFILDMMTSGRRPEDYSDDEVTDRYTRRLERPDRTRAR